MSLYLKKQYHFLLFFVVEVVKREDRESEKSIGLSIRHQAPLPYLFSFSRFVRDTNLTTQFFVS